jgi:hypothetical protein
MSKLACVDDKLMAKRSKKFGWMLAAFRAVFKPLNGLFSFVFAFVGKTSRGTFNILQNPMMQKVLNPLWT